MKSRFSAAMTLRQHVLHCRCGCTKVVARNLCAVCYTLRWQDEEHFGGLREVVLDRDRRRCRVCSAPGGRKRSLGVHHRVPGRSELKLMVALCPACHAMVTRTLMLHFAWPLLLRVLWREQHPRAHEQLPLDFPIKKMTAEPIPLSRQYKEGRGNDVAMESVER